MYVYGEGHNKFPVGFLGFSLKNFLIDHLSSLVYIK